MELTEEKLAEYRRIAYYYYREHLAQGEIASLLGTSRQRVNRILQKCEELGIVRIEIADPGRQTEMEISLAKSYDLRAVRIAKKTAEQELEGELGRLGAEYLRSILKSGDVIGFSRGRAAYAAVQQLPELGGMTLTVTQLTGNTVQLQNADEDRIETDQIVREFARKTGASINRLSFPVLVQNTALKESIQNDASFAHSYRILKHCSTAVVGIGTAATFDMYLRDVVREFPAGRKQDARGAAGEICTHFFDENGEPAGTDLRSHIIAIEREDFLGIPVRIGIAGGSGKEDAIRGALKGHLINVLVTDSVTAEALLSEEAAG